MRESTPPPPNIPPPNVPPENLASPVEMDWGDDVTWWKPGYLEIAKLMGWRWLLVLPVVALIVLLALAPMDPIIWQMMWIGGIKLLVIIISLPFILAGQAFSQAVKLRDEPFCIHCGYGLVGLPDNHRCPECGRPYTFAMIEEYRRDPQWFIQRWKQRHAVPARDQPFVAGVSRRKSRDGT
jgi:hypothetical protein